MLVTFQSTATPDVLMLKELAQYLLGIAGKRLGIRGVIQHDELLRAISRIERALSDEEKAEIAEDALNCIAQAPVREHGSGITQRVWPLLNMMRQADRQHADIVWGI
jgi:uncharacterized protein (UPF0335 family)